MAMAQCGLSRMSAAKTSHSKGKEMRIFLEPKEVKQILEAFEALEDLCYHEMDALKELSEKLQERLALYSKRLKAIKGNSK
jgi:hypothetical protein